MTSSKKIVSFVHRLYIKVLFLNAAIDNTDHDPSSNGAKSSFHGTSISFFGLPKPEVSFPNHFKLEKDADNLYI